MDEGFGRWEAIGESNVASAPKSNNALFGFGSVESAAKDVAPGCEIGLESLLPGIAW